MVYSQPTSGPLNMESNSKDNGDAVVGSYDAWLVSTHHFAINL